MQEGAGWEGWVIYDIIVPCRFTVARRPWLTLSSGLLLPSQGRIYPCPVYNPFSGSATHQPLLLVPPGPASYGRRSRGIWRQSGNNFGDGGAL